MPTIETIIEKIEGATSQNTLKLGGSQSQTFLDDDESHQMETALRANKRVKRIDFKNVNLTPASAGYITRTCISHPSLEKVTLMLFRSINSPSQKHSTRMLEEIPEEVECYINNHPDMKRLGFFRVLNSRTLKLTSTCDNKVYETNVCLPNALIDFHIEPYLRPKKSFTLE